MLLWPSRQKNSLILAPYLRRALLLASERSLRILLLKKNLPRFLSLDYSRLHLKSASYSLEALPLLNSPLLYALQHLLLGTFFQTARLETPRVNYQKNCTFHQSLVLETAQNPLLRSLLNLQRTFFTLLNTTRSHLALSKRTICLLSWKK
ncbi:Uncharacterised protein [Chlamydia trachomatis]|nr:Uncharacterised protein [Chlamydia trachomatis]CRH73510.1 Uncharacterised protein [Chlamydia trachomatis]CRI74436.1 Uncharacterised protein [Chlamydia trachomatis]